MTEQLRQPLKVALVAGEASGDILGAGLMQAIRNHCPQVEFIGVGGPLMQAQGLQSYFPMERLGLHPPPEQLLKAVATAQSSASNTAGRAAYRFTEQLHFRVFGCTLG